MRALVTGASGHLGSSLTRQLIAVGADVTVILRPGGAPWRLEGSLDHVTVGLADLGEPRALAAAVREAAPEVVFHVAWWGIDRARRDDAAQITINVPAALAVVDAAQSAGCRVFVGVGSQAEYGPVEGVLSEEVPARPTTAYGVAKHAVATLTREVAARGGIRWSWLRLLATYGPMDTEGFLIPSVTKALLAGHTPALSAGAQEWDYLFVDDAAAALLAVARTAEASGVFNLASGTAHSVRTIAEKLRDLVDPSLPLAMGVTSAAGSLRADVSRLREATGWTPRVELDEGLRRTVDWYRARAAEAPRNEP